METTWGSLRDGGKGGVEISKPMQYSAKFTNYHESTIALYTCGMSQVQKIQQTSPLVESTLPFTSYSHLYPFQAKSPHILSISMSSNPILTNAISEVLIQNSDHSLPASSSNVEGKLRNMPLPPFLLPKRRPGPYPCNLTLKISSRHPHCLASDRLRCWLPAAPRGATGGEQKVSGTLNGPHVFAKEDHQCIVDVMSHTWEEDTQETYGSGLLVYHVYCDGKNIPEHERALASQLLLSGFMSTLAESYSGKTISNYFYGV